MHVKLNKAGTSMFEVGGKEFSYGLFSFNNVACFCQALLAFFVTNELGMGQSSKALVRITKFIDNYLNQLCTAHVHQYFNIIMNVA